MSSFSYPNNLMIKMTDNLWFPRPKEVTESSLDQLEREEEEFSARMKGIAEIEASIPIGVTPAILKRHQQRVQEIKEMMNLDEPTVKTLFWNRERKNADDDDNDNKRASTIENQYYNNDFPVTSTRQQNYDEDLMSRSPDISKSPNRLDDSGFSAYALNTPRSAASQNFSYSLATPQSANSFRVLSSPGESSTGSLNVSMR